MLGLAIGHVVILVFLLYIPYRIFGAVFGLPRLSAGHIKIGALGLALMTFAFWISDLQNKSELPGRVTIVQQSAHPESFYTFNTVYRGK